MLQKVFQIFVTRFMLFIPSASILLHRERNSFRFMIYQADPVGWYFDLRGDPGRAAHQHMRQTAEVVTGRDLKGSPVVPIRVRGGVVRVDVARPIVGAIVQVAATAHSTHCVGIHEVGGRGEALPVCTAIPDEVLRVAEFFEGLRPLCCLRSIHPYWAM